MSLTGLQGKVLKIQSLGWAQDDQVRKLLKLAADTVAPIMKKHGWTINLLKELSPKVKKNKNLLGLNQTALKHVSIKVRKTSDPWGLLYSFEEIVGTLLHELVHFEIGPHNSDFDRLLEKITNETELEMSRSIQGRSVMMHSSASYLDTHCITNSIDNSDHINDTTADFLTSEEYEQFQLEQLEQTSHLERDLLAIQLAQVESDVYAYDNVSDGSHVSTMDLKSLGLTANQAAAMAAQERWAKMISDTTQTG